MVYPAKKGTFDIRLVFLGQQMTKFETKMTAMWQTYQILSLIGQFMQNFSFLKNACSIYNCKIINKLLFLLIKTFSVLIYSYINTSGNGKLKQYTKFSAATASLLQSIYG